MCKKSPPTGRLPWKRFLRENDQLEKVLDYVDIGQQEGAKLALGGKRVEMEGDHLAGGLLCRTHGFCSKKFAFHSQTVSGWASLSSNFR